MTTWPPSTLSSPPGPTSRRRARSSAGGPRSPTRAGSGNGGRRVELVELGARPGLQEAAALGLLDRVEEFLAADAPAEYVTSAFWQACHGGKLSTAQHLLSRGADIDWIGYDRLTPLDIALTGEHTELIAWLKGSGAHTGAELASGPGG